MECCVGEAHVGSQPATFIRLLNETMYNEIETVKM
jgi:hypothetical protein